MRYYFAYILRELPKLRTTGRAAGTTGEVFPMPAVYAISDHQPCAWIPVIARLIHQLHGNAKWHGHWYTDNIIPDQFQPKGYEPTWCTDMHPLRCALKQHPECMFYVCVCVVGWVHLTLVAIGCHEHELLHG